MRILYRAVRVAVAAAVMLLASAAVAGAASITVTNFSFESPDVPDGAVSSGVVPGWTLSSGALVFDPTISSLPSGTTDGAQVLFLQAIASATQTLGSVLTANTLYDLRVDVGSRADINFADSYDIALLAGSTVLGTDSSPVPAAGSFVLAQVLYTATAADPLLGQALSIRLRHVANTSNTVLMDNVRLDGSATTTPPPSAVPEPASMLLVGSGVALFAMRRRQRT